MAHSRSVLRSGVRTYAGGIAWQISREIFHLNEGAYYWISSVEGDYDMATSLIFSNSQVDKANPSLQVFGNPSFVGEFPVVDLFVNALLYNGVIRSQEGMEIMYEPSNLPIPSFKTPAGRIICDNPSLQDSSALASILTGRQLSQRQLLTVDDSNQEERVEWVTDDCRTICELPRSSIHKWNLLHRGIGAIVTNIDRTKIYLHKRSASKRLFPSKLDMFIGGVSKAKESPICTLLRELQEECGLDLSSLEKGEFENESHVSRSQKRRNKRARSEVSSELAFEDENIDSSSSYNVGAPLKEGPDRKFGRSWISSSSSPSSSSCSFSPSVTSAGSWISYIGQTDVHTDYNHCIVDCFLIQLSDQRIEQGFSFTDGEIEWGKWVSLSELNQLLDGDGEQHFVPDGLQVT